MHKRPICCLKTYLISRYWLWFLHRCTSGWPHQMAILHFYHTAKCHRCKIVRKECRPCVTTPAWDLSIQQLHLRGHLWPAAADSCCNNGFAWAKYFCTNCLREAHLHVHHSNQGLILGGQMLNLVASGTLERCSLHRWKPVFTVHGRRLYSVMWVSR